VDNGTEQLADGVWRIELSAWASVVLLANDGHGDADGLTLVDAGMRGAGPRLVRSVRMAGLNPQAIGDVLLTNWHAAHAGGARRLADSSAAPTVWIGGEDLPVLTGERSPGETATDCSAAAGLLHRHLFRAPPPVDGAQALPDGHVHPAAGGAHVVATPGHTAGHRSVHLPERGVLIAGDAVMNLGRLRPGPSPLSNARSQVRASIERLAALDFSVLSPAHGPPVDRRARERLAALLD
jgi:glyoxylase-like metal-dependent hydrolase (beta-lactamase superfamily II)